MILQTKSRCSFKPRNLTNGILDVASAVIFSKRQSDVEGVFFGSKSAGVVAIPAVRSIDTTEMSLPGFIPVAHVVGNVGVRSLGGLTDVKVGGHYILKARGRGLWVSGRVSGRSQGSGRSAGHDRGRVLDYGCENLMLYNEKRSDKQY